MEAPVERKEEPSDNMRSGLGAMMQSNQISADSATTTTEDDSESPAANARFFGWLFGWYSYDSYDSYSSEEDDTSGKNIVYMNLVNSKATINLNK